MAVNDVAGRTIGITERTERLRARIISKVAAGEYYAQNIGVCVERARYLTESYRQTEGEPEVIRRAKALANVLDNMTIFIKPEELLVGYIASEDRLLPFYPEISPVVITQHLEDGYVPDELKGEVLEIIEYWKGKTLGDRVTYDLESELSSVDMQIINSQRSVLMDTHSQGFGVMTPDYEHVLKHGLNGLVRMIENELVQLGKVEAQHSVFFKNLEIKHFYRAMIIASQAAIRWGKRYSQLAKEMAEKESDAKRKEELIEISMICDKVPGDPPETFHEALQEFTFIHLITNQIERCTHGLGQRFDQLFWPHYENSVIRGKISREQAQELVECLWIKLSELGILHTRARRLSHVATSLFQGITVGGVNANGEDACNELTSVALDALRSIRTNQPSMNFRYHSTTPPQYLFDALEVINGGMGMPAIRNDNVVIQEFLQRGATLEQARNWAVSGCVTETILGVQANTKRQTFNLIAVKCFELALNNGRDIINGQQLGPETGDASKFSSYEQVVEAFRKQIAYTIKVAGRGRAITSYHESECMQRPFASILFRKTMEVKKDIMSWDEKPTNPWVTVTGVVDIVDSLAAIKKLVFEEKRLTMSELIGALRKNWEGKEEIRQMFINDAPKFGNDDDYVDLIARDVFKLIWDVFMTSPAKTYFGDSFIPSYQSVAYFNRFAPLTGALPNGRRIGDPLADGGLAPYLGYDKKGPTAVLKSCSKVDHVGPQGILLNQRLPQKQLQGDQGRQLFLKYIKTWYDLGLSQVQINVVDSKTLKAAQKEPEKYPNLMIRVAGYSAHWHDLDTFTQDAIIARTEQVLT